MLGAFCASACRSEKVKILKAIIAARRSGEEVSMLNFSRVQQPITIWYMYVAFTRVALKESQYTYIHVHVLYVYMHENIYIYTYMYTYVTCEP